MFAQSLEALPKKIEEEFSRPVESIMRCEDFKSNFARRLSNRYISRSSVSISKQDLKISSVDNGKAEDAPNNVPESIELCSQLSKNYTEQNIEVVKQADKTPLRNYDMQCTEVNALNMEVETLRWQLTQTEANRQMHIALLRQIVTFLNRVKKHIEYQSNEPEPKRESTRILPRSLNFADLPRSRSVVHVNKNPEYSLSLSKKNSTRKISKSISNVNGLKDSSSTWNQSKLSLSPETEISQKICEEMSRLITLAKTVLSTNLPDLACLCIDKTSEENNIPIAKVTENTDTEEISAHDKTASTLNVTENPSVAINSNTICDIEESYSDLGNFMERDNIQLNDYNTLPSTLKCGLENESNEDKMLPKNLNNFVEDHYQMDRVTEKQMKSSVYIKNDFISSNFIEDESGFSSMNSFQEIGIPIISIIPPSPCEEMGFLEDVPDILEDSEKWKTDRMELERQTVKVFWV